jgi:hypothetical protein
MVYDDLVWEVECLRLGRKLVRQSFDLALGIREDKVSGPATSNQDRSGEFGDRRVLLIVFGTFSQLVVGSLTPKASYRQLKFAMSCVSNECRRWAARPDPSNCFIEISDRRRQSYAHRIAPSADTKAIEKGTKLSTPRRSKKRMKLVDHDE